MRMTQNSSIFRVSGMRTDPGRKRLTHFCFNLAAVLIYRDSIQLIINLVAFVVRVDDVIRQHPVVRLRDLEIRELVRFVTVCVTGVLHLMTIVTVRFVTAVTVTVTTTAVTMTVTTVTVSCNGEAGKQMYKFGY